MLLGLIISFILQSYGIIGFLMTLNVVIMHVCLLIIAFLISYVILELRIVNNLELIIYHECFTSLSLLFSLFIRYFDC